MKKQPKKTVGILPASVKPTAQGGNGGSYSELGKEGSVAALVAARYDSDARYNSGVRYYEPAPVDTEPTSSPSKVKMLLRSRSDEDLAAYVGNHIGMTTDNPDFPTPQPPPAELAAALTLFTGKVAASIEARDVAKLATTEKDMSREALIDLMVARGAYVQTASGGNAAKIQSTGLNVANPRTPVGPLMPPTNIQTHIGTVPGVMELTWTGVDGAKTYAAECSRDVMPRVFSSLKGTSKTRMLLENLTVGETLVFRMASVGGSTGQSPWSAEVIRVVA